MDCEVDSERIVHRASRARRRRGLEQLIRERLDRLIGSGSLLTRCWRNVDSKPVWGFRCQVVICVCRGFFFSEVCPGKAGMFSRRQSCRGKTQSPVVWIAEEMETEPSKPIDKISRGEITSHRAVSKENALWPRKK